MSTFKRCTPYHSLIYNQTIGSPPRSLLSSASQSPIRIHNSGHRSKEVAIKIFTNRNQTDFKEKREAALNEADLMFKLAGMCFLKFRSSFYPFFKFYYSFMKHLLATVENGLEEFVVKVHGYASGKLPNIFPDSIADTYGIQAGDDAVACVSD